MNNSKSNCNSNECNSNECNSNECNSNEINSNIINNNIIFSASYGCLNYGKQGKYGFIEKNKSINNCHTNYHSSNINSTPSIKKSNST
jgi:hypothetical protein